MMKKKGIYFGCSCRILLSFLTSVPPPNQCGTPANLGSEKVCRRPLLFVMIGVEF
ncbi:uncharacterized protein LOC143223673 isoform X2 [Tachypleus tridentatus]|uniref:uncharacterized protein LOC143223673 isoform X2 n=1 Tax=Tachypleus tridentatus TaxID=6853 RepID=UPI003FCF51AD